MYVRNVVDAFVISNGVGAHESVDVGVRVSAVSVLIYPQVLLLILALLVM